MLHVEVRNVTTRCSYLKLFATQTEVNTWVNRLANDKPEGMCPTLDAEGYCNCHIKIIVYEDSPE